MTRWALSTLTAALRRPEVRRRYLAVPGTAVVFWVLQERGLLADVPIALLLLILATSALLSTAAHSRWPAGCSRRALHARMAVETAGITASVYSTGWGPLLSVGYVFNIADHLQTDGSSSARPALLWSIAGIGAGQAAIALGVAPSLVDHEMAQGMAALTGLGLVVVAHVATSWAAGKERAEAVLRHSERRFRSLVQNAADLVVVSDLDGVVHYVSPAVTAMLGFTPEELIGSVGNELLHVDDLDDVRAMLGVLAAGAHGTAELRVRHRDGSWRTVEVTATNLLDDEDVAGIVLNVHDVTERRRAEEQLRLRAAQQAAVATLGEQALRRVPLVNLLDRALAMVVDALHVPFADVLELSDDETLLLRASVGWVGVMPGVSTVDAGGGSPEHRALAGDGPAVVDDLRAATDVPASALLERHGVRCSAAVVIPGHDQPFGLLRAHAPEPGNFGTEDVSFLQAVANVLADAIEHKRAEEEIAHRALHDPLTGLPNRALLLDRLGLALSRLERHPASVALLFLDLDRFKVVNDSLGHDAGDKVLVEVAGRLRSALRPGDTVARFGGDEFAVLCENVSDRLPVATVARRIASALEAPFQLGDDEVSLSASIGIAIADDARQLPQDLLRDADAAMYRAKEQGKSSYEIFDQTLRHRALQRLETENALRRALERGELHVVYQPEISLAEGEIVGVEALLRWEHPTAGWVRPAQFIPLAEETGLIVPIGSWVLAEACRQAASWQRQLAADVPLNVAVNLSARQLVHPSLVDVLAATLAETGIPADSLSLEITESVLMEDAEFFLESLLALKIFGVRLVIDDFGIGYSSLNYLKRFPVDALKVDRSFVSGLGRDPQDSAIVGAVVKMAEALGLDVIAEGVETDEQADELRALGCRMAQGYLFARPERREVVEHLLLGTSEAAAAPAA